MSASKLVLGLPFMINGSLACRPADCPYYALVINTSQQNNDCGKLTGIGVTD